jgi:ABC-type polysaccharide transport system, permease component
MSTRAQASFWRNWQLYLFLLPALVYFAVFRYAPMVGLQIAFKDYAASLGFWGSPWVGLEHFRRFFSSAEFLRLLSNTIVLSLYQLAVMFPLPILLALMINQLKSQRFRRVVQTVIYAPHFISTVTLVGILFVFLSPRNGMVNSLIVALGGKSIFFLGDPLWFRHLYVISSAWQDAGWGTIVYLAALTSISPELHEAAIIDGASKLQRIKHIDLPGIMPTAVIMLILNLGNLMSIGFEKSFLMQTSLNISRSEIISTYVYKVGLLGAQFSFATAVGLFNSAINLVLILTVNKITKRLGEVSLF